MARPELWNEQLEAWVSDVLGGGAISHVQRLYGGTSADMFVVRSEVTAMSAADQGEAGAAAVLRLYTNAQWREEQPDLALHEMAALQAAAGAGLAAPRGLAVDVHGVHGGVPALLMSYLPGAVALQPQGLSERLEAMAAAALHIHRVDGSDFAWKYKVYQDFDTFVIPSWPRRPELLAQALDVLRNWHPHGPQSFIHRDFHPGNLLFSDGRLQGIVDWANACGGPPQVDVGQCRLDLAQLYGLEAADEFLQLYCRDAPADFVYDPRWDMHCLFDILFGPPQVDEGWKQLGVTHLTDQMVADRLEALLEQALRRWGQ